MVYDVTLKDDVSEVPAQETCLGEVRLYRGMSWQRPGSHRGQIAPLWLPHGKLRTLSSPWNGKCPMDGGLGQGKVTQ